MIKKKKASILIFAIWVLVFFGVINAALYKIASARIQLTREIELRQRGYYAARFAYFSALENRARDLKEYDTLSGFSVEQKKEFDNLALKYHLVDENSKININVAGADILARLPGMDEKIAANIVVFRTEQFKNKEELLLVPGLTRDIFSKCAEFITVNGSGPVNINTADEKVLTALGLDAGVINIIKKNRPSKGSLSDGDSYFDSASRISLKISSSGVVDPRQMSLILNLVSRKLLDVKSEAFTIKAECGIGSSEKMNYDILVNHGKIISWQEG
jgi:type II secretory pathway component PulK